MIPIATRPILLLAARALLAFLFLHEAAAKLQGFEGAVQYAEAFGVPGIMLMPAIALELIGGLALLCGAGTQLVSLALSGFCIITALIFHTHFGDRNQLLHFEKDLAIAGGSLALAVCGAGAWSVDRWVDGRWGRGQTGSV